MPTIGKVDHRLGEMIRQWESNPDLKAIVYDSPPGDDNIYGAFPIFSTDTLEMVINKYVKVFPEEIKYTMKDITEKKRELHRANGMSKNGNMRQSCSLPHTLGAIINQYFPKYLTKEGIHKLKPLIPNCFV